MAQAMLHNYGTRSMNKVKNGSFSLAGVVPPQPPPLPMPTIPPMPTGQKGGVAPLCGPYCHGQGHGGLVKFHEYNDKGHCIHCKCRRRPAAGGRRRSTRRRRSTHKRRASRSTSRKSRRNRRTARR